MKQNKRKISLTESKLRNMVIEAINEIGRFDPSFKGAHDSDADVRYYNRKTNFDGTDFLDEKNNDVWKSVYAIFNEISDLQERLRDYGRQVKTMGASEPQMQKLRKLYVHVRNLYNEASNILDMYNGGWNYSLRDYDDNGKAVGPSKTQFGNWYTHNNVDPD